MFVTGDSSSKYEDTRSEKSFNDYTIIFALLKQFRPTDRVPKLNPPIVPSAGFINSIFEAGTAKYFEAGTAKYFEAGTAKYKGLEIIIGDHCKKMIEDLLYQLEDSDDTALKKRVTDSQTGQTYEQYGHYNDLFRYACCTIFRDEFEIYKRGGKTGFSITLGKNLRSSKNWCDSY
jgi:hypothetical protein